MSLSCTGERPKWPFNWGGEPESGSSQSQGLMTMSGIDEVIV